MPFYRYFGTRQPSPGNMASAFAMPSSLPVIETDGPGIRVFWSFRPEQPPQVYQIQAVKTSGFGGLITNGIIHQPLLDTGGF